jgi:hypothetical protein
MVELAARLSRSIGTHVEDATSLAGAFDLPVTWPRDDRFGGRGASTPLSDAITPRAISAP